jgi:hypothetical protein
VTLAIPLFLMVALATMFTLRRFRTGTAGTQGGRVSMLGLILLPVVVCSLAQGRRFLTDIQFDERTPKSLGREGQSLLESSATVSHSDLVVLYRLFAEVTLAPTYSQQYLISKERRAQFVSKNKLATNPTRRSADEEEESPAAAPFSNPLDYIPVMFSDLSENEMSRFLTARLKWIHPVNEVPGEDAGLALPGLTARQRIENLTDGRVLVVLTDQDLLRQQFLSHFQYSPVVKNTFAEKKDDDPQSTVSVMLQKVFGNTDQISASSFKDVYPISQLRDYPQALVHELALPFTEEAYVAFCDYRAYSARLAVRDGGQVLSSLLSTFESLDSEQQRAVAHYVSLAPKPQAVISTLAAVSSVDFPPPGAQLQLRSVGERIEELAAGRTPTTAGGHEAEAALAQKVFAATARSADSRLQVVALLKQADPAASVSRLLTKQVLDLSEQISQKLNSEQQGLYIQLTFNPIRRAASELIKDMPEQARQLLTSYVALTPEEQDKVLHYLALGLYRSGGEYSLNPLKQMIVQAQSVSDLLGHLTSFAIFFPLFLIAAGVGYFGAGRLVALDRLRLRTEQEASVDDASQLSTEFVDLVGRRSDIERATRLTRRGRSTVALTGKRGSGKSRLLREIFRSETASRSVGVWIDCPTRYEQDEFVSAMLERLAMAVEARTAKQIGIPNVRVRRLNDLLFREMLAIYSCMSMCLLLGFYSVFSATPRPDLLSLWAPIWLMALPALSLLVFERHSQTAPSNFVSNDDHNYDTSVLYEKTAAVLRYLSGRSSGRLGARYGVNEGVRIAILSVVGLIFMYFAVEALFYKPAGGLMGAMGIPLPSRYQEIALALSFGFFWVVIYLSTKRGDSIPEGTSLITLVEAYRQYAKDAVFRLAKQALGSETRGIVVCIDELDKITNVDDMRQFIRTIKTITSVR